MLEAITGDMVGSACETKNIKTRKFPFCSQESQFTDDTVIAIAVAKALMDTQSHLRCHCCHFSKSWRIPIGIGQEPCGRGDLTIELATFRSIY